MESCTCRRCRLGQERATTSTRDGGGAIDLWVSKRTCWKQGYKGQVEFHITSEFIGVMEFPPKTSLMCFDHLPVLFWPWLPDSLAVSPSSLM